MRFSRSRRRRDAKACRVWKACSGAAQYRREACQPFFAMLARRGIWQTPTLGALSELATIGTPRSAISSEHMAYANKRLRDMWAGNQSLFATNSEVVAALQAQAGTAKVVVGDMA